MDDDNDINELLTVQVCKTSESNYNRKETERECVEHKRKKQRERESDLERDRQTDRLILEIHYL